jgi:predicted metal-dependent HD superfamily phosphohydrolase
MVHRVLSARLSGGRALQQILDDRDFSDKRCVMGPNARDQLHAGWMRLLAAWDYPPPAGRRAFDDLAAHYGATGRHYHTLDHVEKVLETLRELGGAGRPVLELAAWLHDVIYDPRAGDNEVRSAAYVQGLCAPLGLPEEVADEAGRLILLTRTHETTEQDTDGQILLDADLAVLSAAPSAYDRYAAAIRQEYAWVPEDRYRAGRRQVLEHFLRRPWVYATQAMRARAEGPARANLRRELAAWE